MRQQRCRHGEEAAANIGRDVPVIADALPPAMGPKLAHPAQSRLHTPDKNQVLRMKKVISEEGCHELCVCTANRCGRESRPYSRAPTRTLLSIQNIVHFQNNHIWYTGHFLSGLH